MSEMSIVLTAEMLSTLLMVIGVLAFVVSVVTEVIKGLGFMKKIPTDIAVIVLSIVLTMSALLAYLSYAKLAYAWYYFVGAFIGAFFVAFVAMYGWVKMSELWNRFKPTDNKE